MGDAGRQSYEMIHEGKQSCAGNDKGVYRRMLVKGFCKKVVHCGWVVRGVLRFFTPTIYHNFPL